MIAQFHQTKSYPICEYVLTNQGGQALGTAENRDGKNAVLQLPDGVYEIHFTLEKSVGTDGIPICRHPLSHDGRQIGSIEQRSTIKKVRFLKWEGYNYQVFPVGNELFELCEVGLGAGQHYFCLHRGGVTAAIVHMSDLEQDYCNDYTIYAEDDAALTAACIGIMYMEGVSYNNRDPDVTRPFARSRMTKTRICNTVDPSLRARFDPNFIPHIQARDQEK